VYSPRLKLPKKKLQEDVKMWGEGREGYGRNLLIVECGHNGNRKTAGSTGGSTTGEKIHEEGGVAGEKGGLLWR